MLALLFHTLGVLQLYCLKIATTDNFLFILFLRNMITVCMRTYTTVLSNPRGLRLCTIFILLVWKHAQALRLHVVNCFEASAAVVLSIIWYGIRIWFCNLSNSAVGTLPHPLHRTSLRWRWGDRVLKWQMTSITSCIWSVNWCQDCELVAVNWPNVDW